MLLAAAPAAHAEPARILLTGDSMMSVIETVTAAQLEGLGAEVETDSRVGSGLTKPFVFDWVTTAPGQAHVFHPDVTVAFLGAGDVYPLRRHGRTYRCCGRQWVAAWAAKAAKMIRAWRDGTGSPDSRVLWATIPAPRDRPLARVFAAINRGIRRAVAAAGERAAIVDLARTFTPGWRYRRTMVRDGLPCVVRQRDGVHISQCGAAIAAAEIIRVLWGSGAPATSG